MRNRIVVDFLKQYWHRYVLGIVFLVLSSYIQALSPKVLGIIIDILELEPIDSQRVMLYISYLILIAIGAFITRFIWRYFIMGNARNMECYLRQKLFQHFQKMSVEFYNHRKTGDLIAYATNDVSAVRRTFGPGVALIINGVGLSFISIFTMVRSVDFRLTLLSLLPIPFIIFVIIKLGFLIRQRFRRVQEGFASISDRVQENISGIRVIKSYVQEEKEVERFERLNQHMKDVSIDMVRVSSILSPLIQVLFGISFGVNLIYGSNLVRSGAISLGDFVAFNGYLTMIMAPVISIGRIINVFQRGMASFKRLDGIFQIEPEIVDGVSDMPIKEIKGSIDIKDLTFYYPQTTEPILKDINIQLKEGQILGIIGKTGSGKTTLVNLLLKLYNVRSGHIFIDGKDINEFPLEVLRENIGYVPQDNFLFSATIQDNIRFFNDEFTDDEVENAAKMSLIYHNIMEFPEKFETMLGERGVNLSGGQKQRISIARAIIKHPAIIILDDALSAVDMETEEKILKNLKKLMKGSTGIIIAHRISAIKHADQIIVMDHGRIVERGNHEQLLRNKGFYYDLYQEQYRDQKGKKIDYEASQLDSIA